MIVQICPPGRGGVRDYAECLAAAWETLGVASCIVEGAAPVAGRSALGGRIDDILFASDDAATVPAVAILHFSGYGYARRGLCLWLVDELRLLKSRHGPRLRLLVVFHELFAVGVPWRSAFWLAPVQSMIARRVAALADGLWTNTGQHAAWLGSVVEAGKAIAMRPVFSNVGEPASPLRAWADRAPRLLVFGSASTRRRALSALQGQQAALEQLGISEVVEVGPDGGGDRPRGAIESRRLGRLPVADLSALLLGSRYGLIDYPARYLGKSGVFAAYAAHGCTVIETRGEDRDVDGLSAGIHYLAWNARELYPAEEHGRIAWSLGQWYRQHTLPGQADELLRLALPALPRSVRAP